MRRKSKAHKKRKFSFLPQHFNRLRGASALILLIGIVIIGSIFFVGGVFPNENPDLEKLGEEAELDTTVPVKESERNNLQLQTLKFKQCEQAAAVDFLVDNSGSMRGSKLSDLKNGLVTFAANYPEQGVIGLQVYSSPGFIRPLGVKELVPISKYSDVKNNFTSAVNSMEADGSTHSKSAMEFAKLKLQQAMPNFPTYKFNLIFISDGIPEDENPEAVRQIYETTPELCSGNSLQLRCFAQNQNPENVATEIKAMGVRIFTISYLDDRDAKFNTLLQNLMRSVASAPEDYYQAPVSSQVTAILAQISQKICK